MSITNSIKGFTLTAYQGDAKTLLAFDLPKSNTAGLAGFTIQVQPHGKPAYYLLNKLLLPPGPKHAVLPGEPADSTANAPIQKYRWLHVPGSFHQGDNVFYGTYTYTVTPRYFKKGALQPLDHSLSNSVDIQVAPFVSGQLELAFTRGFVQSQGFVHHFGPNAPFQPQGAAKTLLFDTNMQAGANQQGQHYTFSQEYEWSGYTARQRIFGVLNEVVSDPSLTVDVFAYDLNEPDIIKIFLKLAGEGRIRLILDNADLHHSTTQPKPEDQVETLFNQAAKAPAAILRGSFGRYAHDKIFVVYKYADAPAQAADTITQAANASHRTTDAPHAASARTTDASARPDEGFRTRIPIKVLTGSTNFSVTGLYVNANHVLIFNNGAVAGLYAKVFQESWNDKATESFSGSSFARQPFPLNQKGLPKMSITFSPHPGAFASSNLQTIADRIGAEKSSVLFAVMSVSEGGGPVLPALMNIHANQQVFSYGISDSPGTGISLYKPGSKTGVLVTGKPGVVNLPPPFDNEETVGIGHEIHHKFIVCGFNKSDAVVWCGSSNLALGGEEANGDNLIRIDDSSVATVFAIEAVSLVDHFDFRDALSKASGTASGVSAAGNTTGKAPNGNTTGKGIIDGKDKSAKGTKTVSVKANAVAKPVLVAAKPLPIPEKGKATSGKGAGASDDPPKPTLYLHGDDGWVKRYYDTKDLYCTDRLLFSNKL